MSCWKLLLVSLVIVDLSRIDGKTLKYVVGGCYWRRDCTGKFVSQELGSADTATFKEQNSTEQWKIDGRISEIIFQSSSIYYIPASIFEYFPELEVLNMSHSNVQEIRRNTFQMASNLQTLYLDHNKISALGPSTLTEAKWLKSVDLSSNQISFIHVNAFGWLEFLNHVDLSHNLLVTLDPSTFHGYRWLDEIYLNDNRINSLNRQMFRGQSWTVLDLRNNECVNADLSETNASYIEAMLSKCNDNYRLTAPNLTCRNSAYKPCYFYYSELNSDEEPSFAVSNLGPGEKPADINSVNFYYSSIYYIPASIFNYFVNLKWLEIYNCDVQVIRNNTFKNATKLVEIVLSRNMISALGPDTFKGATNLRTIDLEFNQISSIDGNAFRGLPNLSDLKLKDNKITILDVETFSGLKNLVILDLGNNDLSSLHKDIFKNLKNVYDLDLSNNSLVALDPTIFMENPKLKYLYLKDNEIIALNRKMFNRNDIRTLRLENNKCVNDNFYEKDDSSYVEMKLWNCSINFHRMFWSGIFNCSYAGGLCNFYFAELNSDEEPRFAVTNLGPRQTPANTKIVHFYYSSIYYVPASIFTYFPNLMELHLNGSDIYEIRNNTFKNATNLLLVDLSYNNISTLGPDTFKGATSLQTIDLEFNQISSIDGNAFRGLPNLSVLNLSSNFLETLDASTFLDNTKLSSLDFSNNHIKSLSSKMFQTLSNLKLLDLTGNVCVDAYLSGKSQSYIETLLWRCNKNYYKIPKTTLTCTKNVSNDRSCIFYRAELFDYEEPSYEVTSLGPGETLADIKSVQFYSSSIYFVPASIFTYFPNLTELHLSGSKVQEIRSNTFENATALLLIDLSHNNISTLGPVAFQEATNLQSIDLSFNQLSSIDENAFRGLPKLSELSLNNNSIKAIDKDIFRDLRNLSTLDLSINSLRTLDPTIFWENMRLKVLYLNDNKLIAFNRRMFDKNNLKKLELSNNLCIYKNIDKKDDRYFDTCNENYYQMFGRTLNCSYGCGKTCKFYFAEYRGDKGSRFAVIDPKPGQTLASIKSLYFYYSSIYSVPALTGFTNLKKLYLNGCKVKEIRKDAFQKATNLLLIDLKYNKISALGPDSFKGATNLETIDLRFNQLSSIDGNAFRGLPNLSVLDISGNLLEILNVSTFLNNARLSSLHLSNNRIKALSSKMFQTLPNLKRLDLNDNLCVNANLSGLSESHIEELLTSCNGTYHKTKTTLTCSYFFDDKSGESCNFYQAELYSYQEASFEVMETGQSVSHISGVLFKSSSIYYIPASIFTYFTNLTELHLNGCDVQEIRKNTFEKAIKLLLIDLNHNSKIFALGPDTFKGATNLRTIDLEFNQLSAIDGNAFRGLPNLDKLSLANNGIKYLGGNTFSSLTKLRYLNLSYNSIESLHKDIFSHLSNLYDLDLSHNLLETLDESLFQNNRLTILDLSYNRIKSLSKFSMEQLRPYYLNLLGNVCVDAYFEWYPYVRVRYGDSDFYDYLDLDYFGFLNEC
jgi:Leucine-rich repeat (LRR) protein